MYMCVCVCVCAHILRDKHMDKCTHVLLCAEKRERKQTDTKLHVLCVWGGCSSVCLLIRRLGSSAGVKLAC